MSAVRTLAAPIADLTSFATLVQTIMDTNPWGCTSYSSAGVNIPGMVKGAEGYTGTIVYENAEAKTVGRISVKSPTAAAFNSKSPQSSVPQLLGRPWGAVHHMTVPRMDSV